MDILNKLDINTVILLLILMMMFGEYSQRYYKKASWGSKWGMELIAPFIYYISGGFGILLSVLLAVVFVLELLKIFGG